MGLYDKLFLKSTCPYCKFVEIREFQTKDLGCNMNSYSEYDWCKKNYDGDDGFIYGCADCERCNSPLFYVKISMYDGCMIGCIIEYKLREE